MDKDTSEYYMVKYAGYIMTRILLEIMDLVLEVGTALHHSKR